MDNFIGAYPQHREIGFRIVADEISRQLAAVREAYRQLARPMDDMAVGEQVAVGGNKETRTGACRRLPAPDFNMHNGHVVQDRKSTRLNSSHQIISYPVFSLKKKNTLQHNHLHS